MGLFDTPTLGPCRVDLWPFQEEAIEAVRDQFTRKVKRTLLSMCTGSGKTITAASIARRAVERGNRVLFLAHTTELIQQTADKFDMLGVEVGVEQAEEHGLALFKADVVVGSVATMQKPQRLLSWNPDYFDLVIIDEGHRSLAESYRRIMAHFDRARVLVMTATPVRTDEQAIGYICESLAYKFSIRDAWKRGKQDGRQYICDLRIVPVSLGVNLKKLRRADEDFTDRHYDDRVAPMLDMVCNKVREHIGDRTAIQFFPSVRCAQLAAHAQNRWYPTEAIWGADENRADRIRRFREGEIQSVTNMNLFTEGFDVPRCDMVVLARNTNSWSMMLQQIGRGLRAGKADCKVLDLASLTSQFGEEEGFLVQPIDILGETGFDNEIDSLKRILAGIQKREPELTLMNAIEQAEDELVQRRRKSYAIRIAIEERQIDCPEEQYSAMQAYEDGTPGMAATPARQAKFVPATPAQIAFLKRRGEKGCERYSKGQAGTRISYYKRQEDAGKSTMPQRAALVNNGVPVEQAREMTKDQASEFMDRLAQQRERIYGRRKH